jgi:predicted NACHT family NTPase
MARRSKQSIAATSEGLQRANVALKKVCSGKKTILKDFAGVSRSRVQDFFAGNPVGIQTFQAICKALEIEDWQNIAGLSNTINPQPEQRSQESDLDIDALVREVRSHCCEAILDNYSKIRLPDDTRIDVDLLYVDVYVLEKLSSKRYASKSGMLEGVKQREDYERLTLGQRQERLPGQEIVRQFPRLMVLGKPGSGKTTFLRHLAVDCSNGKLFCDRIPVLIELRSIKEGNSFNLLNLIHREFGLVEQEQTQQILNQGKAFILLDGLDEVPSQLRQSVRDQIYEFAKEYRKNHFVLTCRTQTTEYIADNFEPIEVADFDAEQVKLFARNWFTAIPETSSEAEDWTSRFVGKLDKNKQIRELAVTPILLSLTCLLFTAEQDLPTKPSELYEKGSNLLLKQWDRFREIPRDYQQLSVSDKQKLLSYLAFCKFEQADNFILFEQDEIQGYIADHLRVEAEESEAILREIEAHHGLLIERAQGIWSFSHLTFQEYFTARKIVATWNSFATDEPMLQGLVSHIIEKRWREVFLLTVTMLYNADNLLRLMKHRIHLLLAIDEHLQQFLSWVIQKNDSIKKLYKAAAIRSIYFVIGNVGMRSKHRFSGNMIVFSDVFNLATSLDSTLGEDRDLLYRDINLTLDIVLSSVIELAILLQGSPDNAVDSQENNASLPDLNSITDRGQELIDAFLETCAKLIQNLNYSLSFTDDSVFKHKIIRLKKQLPILDVRNSLDLVKFLEWMRLKGSDWTEQLRTVIIEHRNIGHDWQFSDAQIKRLQQYYDANQLLVDCLNSGCNVSPEVKNEIEQTLLLPMTEIEKL